MKGSKLLKSTTAIISAAAVCGSFAVVASAASTSNSISTPDFTEYDNTIQFSAYKIATGTEDRVKNPTWTAEGYKTIDLSTGVWTNGALSSHNNGAYNGGRYICYQTDSTFKTVTNTVTIEDVPTGYYALSQFDTNQSAGASVGIKITVTSDVEGGTYTFNPIKCGDFVELGEVCLSGDVTLKYEMTEAASHLRVDETKLVKRTDKVFAEGKDVNADGEGNAEASVWTATLTGDESTTYTGVDITAKAKTGEVGEVTEVQSNISNITGAGSVFIAMAANKPVSDIESVLVELK